MKTLKSFFLTQLILILITTSLGIAAGDFEWTIDFNNQANQDSLNFKSALADRFNITRERVEEVIGKVEKASDAYIALRIGEISKKPLEEVVEKYKSGKQKGWGALAKSLGVIPGSKEFHALKENHDLYAKTNKDEDYILSNI